ncbi:MAG: outer membrane protein assembly factor BamD [Bacteroidales bacterium]|nr:outer membrane protein assembly factor BamD [Bacteroidales bacterium]
MKYVKILIAAFVACSAVTACKSQYEALLNSNDTDAKYEAAFEYFNNRKYNKAASLFESLSVQTAGTERDDTVRYYWGLSNYRFKDYLTAEANFGRFVESYPRSPFAPEARFLRLDCLYRSTLRYELDQSPTYRAMEAISQYMLEHPGSSHLDVCSEMMDDLQTRLDTKAFEGARLYYHMEDYLAARVAFRNVLKDNSENKFREDILYFTAMASYKYAKLSVQKKQKERYLVFVDDYLNFIGEIPDSKYRKELDAMYKRTQKALGRETVADEDTDKRDKEFAKERRRLEKEAKAAGKKSAPEE